MRNNLFRQEVYEAKSQSWLGPVALSQPVRLWVLTALSLLTGLAVILFLLFGAYTKRTRVQGQLVPAGGIAIVPAPAAGLVSQLRIAEGDFVKAGQQLGVVLVPRSTTRNRDANAAVRASLKGKAAAMERESSAERALSEVQRQGLEVQHSSALRELAQIDAELLTRREQARIANDTLSRYQSLLQDRYVSDLQANQQKAAALEAEAAIVALERQRVLVKRSALLLQQQLDELPLRQGIQAAASKQEMASLERELIENDANGELAFNAPIQGQVTVVTVKPGQAVESGTPLLSIVPNKGELEAELLVPSAGIGFVQLGDRVMLRYQAYPFQKFGHGSGVVSRISRSALSEPALRAIKGSSAPSEPHYRIVVRLDQQAILAYGQKERLKPGLLVDADILGDRRQLIEWVLEPLYSIRGRLGTDG